MATFIISNFEGSQAVPTRPSGGGKANGRNSFMYDDERAEP
jgi:hypothetical protein